MIEHTLEFTAEEKAEIVRHQKDYPFLYVLLVARNRWRFEQNATATNR